MPSLPCVQTKRSPMVRRFLSRLRNFVRQAEMNRLYRLGKSKSAQIGLAILLLVGADPIRVWAVDANKLITANQTFGDWRVVEFAGATKLLYRVASIALNDKNFTLTFDLGSLRDCRPSQGALIIQMTKYSKEFDDAFLPFQYKIPGSPESRPAAFRTTMARNDKFVFVESTITVDLLATAHDKGKLALWTPASGDGVIARGANVYFSLAGFSSALDVAKGLCNDSR